MKNKILCMILAAALLSMYACSYRSPSGMLPGDNTVGSDYSYSHSATETTSEEPLTEPATDETTTEEISQSEPLTAETVTQHEEIQSTTFEVVSDPTVAPSQPGTTVPQEPTQVDLSIEMPEANGKMKVETSARNKYIAAVVAEMKIDASLLAAVFSVPESGQNYVFEFKSENARTVNDLRRVYLLDSNCKIVSVAASDVSEKKNLSPTENWFCMNVLIKSVIFPAVADKF